MPRNHFPRVTSAPASALNALMAEALTTERGTETRVPTESHREAMAFRSRLNKLRATDRARNLAVYVDANKQARRRGEHASIIPPDAGTSVYDDLIFRVDGSTVIIVNGGMSAQELLTLAGFTPAPDFGTPKAPGLAPKPTGPLAPDANYDTAPRADEDPFA